MRRRIYFDRESGPIDVTIRTSLWGFEDWDQDPERLPVLYDDALWEEYERKRMELVAVESLIAERSVCEPWTDDERSLAMEMVRMCDGGKFDAARANAIEDELDAHARTRVDPGEKPFGCSSDCRAPGCGGGCSQ